MQHCVIVVRIEVGIADEGLIGQRRVNGKEAGKNGLKGFGIAELLVGIGIGRPLPAYFGMLSAVIVVEERNMTGERLNRW